MVFQGSLGGTKASALLTGRLVEECHGLGEDIFLLVLAAVSFNSKADASIGGKAASIEEANVELSAESGFDRHGVDFVCSGLIL